MGPVAFTVEQNPTTVVVVTGSDGRRYELRLALVIQAIFETGQTNPLDQTPILQIASQIVTQTTARADG